MPKQLVVKLPIVDLMFSPSLDICKGQLLEYINEALSTDLVARRVMNFNKSLLMDAYRVAARKLFFNSSAYRENSHLSEAEIVSRVGNGSRKSIIGDLIMVSEPPSISLKGVDIRLAVPVSSNREKEQGK